MKKKALFVCSSNLHRSPTAEMMFARSPKYEVKSAGTSQFSKNPVTQEILEWADIIFVMDEINEYQKTHLMRNFPAVKDLEKKVIVLDIPDMYIFGSEELVRILTKRLNRHL